MDDGADPTELQQNCVTAASIAATAAASAAAAAVAAIESTGLGDEQQLTLHAAATTVIAAASTVSAAAATVAALISFVTHQPAPSDRHED